MRKNINRRQFLVKGTITAMLPIIPSYEVLNAKIMVPTEAIENQQLVILNNSRKFNGMVTDCLLCMQHSGNGYRTYNPLLMRFHAQDSMSPFGEGGINSYGYVSGDPLNNTDPSGNHRESISKNLKTKPSAITLGGRMEKISDISGMIIFEDRYHGGKRLNLVCHGIKWRDSNSIQTPNDRIRGIYALTPTALLDELNGRNIDYRSYETLRVAACWSGNGFSQELANLTGKKVKGYGGTISALKGSASWDVLQYINKANVDPALKGRKRRRLEQGNSIFQLIKDGSRNYSPHIFLPAI